MTTARIGIAIGSDEMVVRAAPSVITGGVWSRVLGGAPTAEGDWPELEAAFDELRAALPAAARVTASVMVLPPLVQARRMTLPALRADERRHVLTRDAARYFIGAREPQVADALPMPGAAGDLMAAAMAGRHALAIVRAAERARIEVRTIQPAWWAWAALVDAAQREATRALVVVGAHDVDVVRLERGTVAGVRRLRAGEDLDARVHAALTELGAGAGSAVVVGGERLDSLRGLQRLGDDDAPASVAAAAAELARGPELLPDVARMRRRTAVVRRARALALGAGALLLLSAGVELWGVHRQLGAVRRARAAVAPAVSRAIASRDSATSLEAQLDALAAETRTAPRWTGVIADLAQRLPDDAHLLSLSAMGDSVAIVGEAAHAADVFEALRRDPRVAGVRADAPIRREFAADRTPIERFSVTARLTEAALTTLPSPETP